MDTEGGAPASTVTNTAFGTGATSHNVNMPATVAAGDLLLAFICIPSNSITITTPSGWSVESEIAQASNASLRAQWFSKVAAGTEGGTTVDFVTSSSIRMVAEVFKIFAGTYSASVARDYAVLSNGTTANPDPPSVTTSWGAANNLWIASLMRDREPTVSGYPSGYGDTTTINSNGGAGGTSGITAAAASLTTSLATEDPGSFTLSDAEQSSNTYTVAVPPVTVSQAPPIVASITTSSFGTGVTTHDVNTPAYADGDRMICAVCFSGTGAITTPSGWTEIDTSSGGCRMSVYYRDMVGSGAASTENFATGVNSTGGAIVWLVSAGTFDPAAAPELALSALGAQSTVTTPTLNPSWGAADSLMLALNGRATSTAPTNPTLSVLNMHRGYTRVSNPNASIIGAQRVLRAASSVPVSWNYAGTSDSHSGTLAVKPA